VISFTYYAKTLGQVFDLRAACDAAGIEVDEYDEYDEYEASVPAS
jgi:hypothetical protein